MFEKDQKMQDTADAEFVQFYSKMARMLGVSGVVGESPSALLSVQLPGIVVPVDLDPDDPETLYFVSNLLNAALECNYIVTPKAGLISDVYKLILDGKETPLVELTPKQREDLDAARAYVFEPGSDYTPTPAYAAYMRYEEVFYAAQDAYQSSLATHENGGPDVSPEVLQRYQDAKTDWHEKGNYDQVNNAFATIVQLEGRDPYVYWEALADRYSRSTERLKNSSEFQIVDSLPRYKEWFKDELWSPFVFEERDYKRQRRSGGTGMHGQSRCCCCRSQRTPDGDAPLVESGTAGEAWRDHGVALAASAGWHGPVRPGPSVSVAAGQIILNCSIKRIAIVRPWMDVAVFHSRMWKWSPQSIGRGIEISTGGSVMGNKVATGVLPVLPASALLAKDIEIATTSEQAFGWIRSELEEGHHVRYGPFVITAIHRPARRQMLGEVPVVGVALGAPQLFGYISTIFGKCPNPDPLLPWPS